MPGNHSMKHAPHSRPYDWRLGNGFSDTQTLATLWLLGLDLQHNLADN